MVSTFFPPVKMFKGLKIRGSYAVQTVKPLEADLFCNIKIKCTFYLLDSWSGIDLNAMASVNHLISKV